MASRGYGWPCSVLEPAVQRSIFLVLFAAACSSSALEPSPGPEPTTPIEAQEGPALASSKDNSATVVAVVPRRSWSRGAAQGRFVRHSIRRITVHHTAAPWQLETDGSSRVRQHLEHHRGKGWPDIAYHYVVAGDGTVFEGRPIDTVGDTSTNYDPSGHLLITLEGNFEEQVPSPAQRNSTSALLAWASHAFSIPPEEIRGHQDHAATACPGATVLEWLRSGELAREVQHRLDRGGATLSLPALRHFPTQDSGCVVAVDVGHSKARPGATSARGRPEYDFNWRLSNELVDGLKRAPGVGGAFLVDPAQKGLALKKRTRRAVAGGGDLLLSIHHDSVQPHFLNQGATDGTGQAWSERFRGHSLFVSMRGQKPAASVLLGQSVGRALVAIGRIPTGHHNEPIPGEGRAWIDESLGLYRYDGLAVLRTATIPALLVEAGVIVHPAEELELDHKQSRAELVAALVTGVTQFCAAPRPN